MIFWNCSFTNLPSTTNCNGKLHHIVSSSIAMSALQEILYKHEAKPSAMLTLRPRPCATFPIVHECKWYFNRFIATYMEQYDKANYGGIYIATICIMENKSMLWHFHLLWIHTIREQLKNINTMNSTKICALAGSKCLEVCSTPFCGSLTAP